jgi:hypothetical protein
MSALRAALLVLALAVPVFPAKAHSILLRTQPSANAVIDAPFSTITLEFEQGVETGLARLELSSPGRPDISDWTVQRGTRDTFLTFERAPLPAGRYRARWSVISRDGHRVRGEFTFTAR